MAQTVEGASELAKRNAEAIRGGVKTVPVVRGKGWDTVSDGIGQGLWSVVSERRKKEGVEGEK